MVYVQYKKVDHDYIKGNLSQACYEYVENNIWKSKYFHSLINFTS